MFVRLAVLPVESTARWILRDDSLIPFVPLFMHRGRVRGIRLGVFRSIAVGLHPRRK
jgi:hypothetical protein